MTDGDTLLKAIIDDPHDDLPRLAYADWLEENGQKPWLSRFIRSQLAGEARAVPLPTAMPLRYIVPGCTNVGYQGVARLSHPENGTLTFRRGFLEAVRLPLASAVDHLPRLVREHPLARAEITDRDPVESSSGWWWAAPKVIGSLQSSVLPHPVFRFMVEDDHIFLTRSYGSRELALAAASEAWLAWARSKK